MDIGCYATNLWRVLSQSEPTVTSATAKTIRPNVDRAMHATLISPLGATGTLDASLLSSKLFKLSGKANGSLGSLSLFNPLGPQFYHRLKITTKRSSRIERFDRVPTYNYQLEAFRDAITIGTPFPTTPRDSINTMRIIDAMYMAAGMTPRQPTLVDED